ncbi:hypothetical protein F441_07384 [Phytophthora nicotianae CJ01A1]|uniref:Uncharacterized protein n=1 Tax=Phytophthora nicotianae CJ01A1 TaxID=1317063 RepID=W2X786_PHYNI|nr:hypothetical protein F441_07384 [Phytophthora nicotianae CJ01A1]
MAAQKRLTVARFSKPIALLSQQPAEIKFDTLQFVQSTNKAVVVVPLDQGPWCLADTDSILEQTLVKEIVPHYR